MIKTLWTQSTGIRRLTRQDALEDARRLKEDIDTGAGIITTGARKRYGEYVGYVKVREETE